MKKIIFSAIAGLSGLFLLQNANAYLSVFNDTDHKIYVHHVRLFPGETCNFPEGSFNVQVKRHFNGFHRFVTVCTINPAPGYFEGVRNSVRIESIDPRFNGGCFSYYRWY